MLLCLDELGTKAAAPVVVMIAKAANVNLTIVVDLFTKNSGGGV
jgi:hypothetical protein